MPNSIQPRHADLSVQCVGAARVGEARARAGGHQRGDEVAASVVEEEARERRAYEAWARDDGEQFAQLRFNMVFLGANWGIKC